MIVELRAVARAMVANRKKTPTRNMRRDFLGLVLRKDLVMVVEGPWCAWRITIAKVRMD